MDVTPDEHPENAMLSPRALTGAVSHTKDAAVQCSTIEGIGTVVYEASLSSVWRQLCCRHKIGKDEVDWV